MQKNSKGMQLQSQFKSPFNNLISSVKKGDRGKRGSKWGNRKSGRQGSRSEGNGKEGSQRRLTQLWASSSAPGASEDRISDLPESVTLLITMHMKV